MSKLSSSFIIKDQITGEILFEGSLFQLLDMIFDNTFFKVTQNVTCDCFNFKFNF